jgi:hypothetical protein
VRAPTAPFSALLGIAAPFNLAPGQRIVRFAIALVARNDGDGFELSHSKRFEPTSVDKGAGETT